MSSRAVFLSFQMSTYHRNIERLVVPASLCFREELFLSQLLGIEFRMLSIECSLSLELGQIFSRKLGVLELLPSRKGRQGKHLYTLHLLYTRPSRQPHWFHVRLVSSGVLRDPRVYDRCVRPQSAVSSENQGLSAKIFTRLMRALST